MNVLKNLTLHWWQTSVFKLSLISLGVAIGATWPELFVSWRIALLAVALIAGGYITCVWFRQ